MRGRCRSGEPTPKRMSTDEAEEDEDEMAEWRANSQTDEHGRCGGGWRRRIRSARAPSSACAAVAAAGAARGASGSAAVVGAAGVAARQALRGAAGAGASSVHCHITLVAVHAASNDLQTWKLRQDRLDPAKIPDNGDGAHHIARGAATIYTGARGPEATRARYERDPHNAVQFPSR